MPNASEPSLANVRDGVPLFYLGDHHTFRPLARRLGVHHGFQGLSIGPHIIGQVKNPYSLRCLAEPFVKMIREQQPRGPYMLGGWCADGLLALEAAQQLREQGQDVALLVLLETINPERLRQQPRWIREIARWQIKMNLNQFDCVYRYSLAERQERERASTRFRAQIYWHAEEPWQGPGQKRKRDRFDPQRT